MAAVVVAAVVAAACGAVQPHHAFADPGFAVETLAEDLSVPWAIDFAPDGRIFFTERGGRVMVIGEGEEGAVPRQVLEMDVGTVEGGLLGIALDPDFAENRHVYLYYTYADFIFTYNKVSRFTEGADGGGLTGEAVLIDGIPGGAVHNGGRIRFADDGTLYITTGDAGNPALAQDAGSLGGKILRINPDGSIPGDNPFPGSPVFSLGHRNPQGLDWEPGGGGAGRLVVSEHGPSGERGFGHDEINIVREGRNYGWPEILGDQALEGMEGPVLHSGAATWAPSGAAFYGHDAIPEFAGGYLVATLAGRHLKVVDLDPERDAVTGSREYLAGEYGRLRDIATDDNGNVYVLTSNRDGRGSPAGNDDRILRIVPVEGADHPDVGRDGGGGGSGGGSADPAGRPPDPAPAAGGGGCDGGLVPVSKMSDGGIACVKPGSVQELIRRGWAADHRVWAEEEEAACPAATC